MYEVSYGRSRWTAEDDLTCQLDEDLDDWKMPDALDYIVFDSVYKSGENGAFPFTFSDEWQLHAQETEHCRIGTNKFLMMFEGWGMKYDL